MENPRKQAKLLTNAIVGKLLSLETLAVSSPLETSFLNLFAEVLELVDCYVAIPPEAVQEISCTVGCCDCCLHWVEDVNSFEAQIIADFVRTNLSDRIGAIRQICSDDCHELERLEKLVDAKLRTLGAAAEVPLTDPVDLLLGVFYQMRRPCPLLSEEGQCLIYPVRPLTCRIYVSVSDPLRCNPDYINASVIPTMIVDLSEDANRILDRLHFKFQHFSGDTGLRSLLLRYLPVDDGH